LMMPVFLTGCDDEDDDSDKDEGYAGSLYLIATEVPSGGDDYTSYLVTTKTLDSSTSIGITDGIEIIGRPTPIVYNGAVFVEDASSPVLTRYNTVGDYLEEGERLSFAGVGVGEVYTYLVKIISDTKAYLYDPAGPRMIVWNPQTMTLTGTEIDLSIISRDGYTPYVYMEDFYNAIIKDGKLFVPVSYSDQDWLYDYLSAVLTIDTENDTVLNFTTDDRCGEAYFALEMPDGDILYFASTWSASQHYFSDDLGASCALRIRDGEYDFDPDYKLDLSALVDGKAATGGVPDGDSGFFFLAADPERYADSENNGGTYWQFLHYNPDTEEVTEFPSLPYWADSPFFYQFDSRTVMCYWRENDDESRTTIVYEIESDAQPSELFSFDAGWRHIGKLR